MKPSPISQAVNSQLVIVDMQERLSSAMPAEDMQQVLKNASILLQAARMLEIPAIHTEQYPKGLGVTKAELLPLLTGSQRVEKTVFSCCDEPTFCRKLTSDRPQVVLAGMEAHICILQTALALHAQGRQVFVAEDAVISRNPIHKANALQRLRQAGVIVSNTESIVFEWLGKAEGDAFKQISKLIR
ncbi:nicotinamidase/pyrazinamidase [Methylophilaceae bacterium]|nr:nicotinamidase/pyrazinamidase [Methylophilaceae bacterium]